MKVAPSSLLAHAHVSSVHTLQADSNNHLLRRVNLTSDLVTTLAGSSSRALGRADGVGTLASFYTPSDVAVDSTGLFAVVVRSEIWGLCNGTVFRGTVFRYTCLERGLLLLSEL